MKGLVVDTASVVDSGRLVEELRDSALVAGRELMGEAARQAACGRVDEAAACAGAAVSVAGVAFNAPGLVGVVG